jgi:hypothetical protein
MHVQDDIVLGRKLATGGFGTVFEGKLKMPDGSILPVIVKKAKEFGQAETWMNERMMRIPGRHCAEFITAFDESFGVPDATPGTCTSTIFLGADKTACYQQGLRWQS